MRLLLDSVIVIDHLNGVAAASSYLRDHGEEAAISVITRAEVLAGFGSEEEAAPAAALLDRFPLLAIDGPVADTAARLRREVRWRLPDAFQAALAQRHDLTLVTRNTRDFPPDRHRFVLVPYQLGVPGPDGARTESGAAG